MYLEDYEMFRDEDQILEGEITIVFPTAQKSQFMWDFPFLEIVS